MKVYWVDQEGNDRFTAVNGLSAIVAELRRHEAERVDRIRWLAERHGLTVTDS